MIEKNLATRLGSILKPKPSRTKRQVRQFFSLDKVLPLSRQLEAEGKLQDLVRDNLTAGLLRPKLRKQYQTLSKDSKLSQRGLQVYGHCRTATDAWWLLMGGVDHQEMPLSIKKETMRDKQVHFWLEAGTAGRIDLTAEQLTKSLYPDHNYNSVSVKLARVGSNMGGNSFLIAGKKYNVPRQSWDLVHVVLQKLLART